jgi:hypothetical protein
VREDAPASR